MITVEIVFDSSISHSSTFCVFSVVCVCKGVCLCVSLCCITTDLNSHAMEPWAVLFSVASGENQPVSECLKREEEEKLFSLLCIPLLHTAVCFPGSSLR